MRISVPTFILLLLFSARLHAVDDCKELEGRLLYEELAYATSASVEDRIINQHKIDQILIFKNKCLLKDFEKLVLSRGMSGSSEGTFTSKTVGGYYTKVGNFMFWGNSVCETAPFFGGLKYLAEVLPDFSSVDIPEGYQPFYSTKTTKHGDGRCPEVVLFNYIESMFLVLAKDRHGNYEVLGPYVQNAYSLYSGH